MYRSPRPPGALPALHASDSGLHAASGDVDPPPDQESIKIQEEVVISQKDVNARREFLISTNKSVRVAAEDVKNCRAAREAFLDAQPAVQEVAKKLEVAAARLRQLEERGGAATPDETIEARKLRREIITASREKARMFKTPGAVDSELAGLDKKLAEAEKRLEKELWKDSEMVRLIRIHNQNLDRRMRMTATRQVGAGVPADVPGEPPRAGDGHTPAGTTPRVP